VTTETSIYEYAKAGAMINPDKTAIWFYGRGITYRELFEKIDNVADHLYQRGVREGTVVTIHLPNCPEAVMAIYAVAKLGGICSMVHALTPEAALRESASFTESQILITHLQLNDKFVITADEFKTLVVPCEVKSVIPDQTMYAQKCAFYIHSSGATGKPKTVMLSHSAINHCVDNTVDFFPNGDMSEQICLGVLPLFHWFGLAMDVHRNIHFGAMLIMMERWNPMEAVRFIKEHRVTLIVGVPVMFRSLLNEPSFSGSAISQLRYCYVGGDNVGTDLVELLDQRVGTVRRMLPGFGLTEATLTCVNTYKHYKIDSVGFPVKNTSVAVRKEDGTLKATGIGELVISSPTLKTGYFKDPEATSQTFFEAEGKCWIKTGDAVFIDADGFLFFKERIKNIIIHNGYNIYPGYVEDVIRSVDGVKDVCVVGVADQERNTQIVRAVLIPKQETNQEVLRMSIYETCHEKLPRYSVPRELIFVNEFPQNYLGKIDRKELSKI